MKEELVANVSPGLRRHTSGVTYTPIDQECRHAVPTACAAWHLNRRPQTMRCWACYENGPLRPTRINGRLAWKTDDLRRVLGVAA